MIEVVVVPSDHRTGNENWISDLPQHMHPEDEETEPRRLDGRDRRWEIC